MTIELERLLSPERYARLREEADRQHKPMSDLVRGAFENYLDKLAEDDIEDMLDEVILEHLRQAVADVNAGRTRPAREAMAELRKKLADEKAN